jgi:predicted secreted hydrolase
VEWKIIIPPEELEITVRSLLDDHEFWTPKTTGIHYWEGPVQVSGKRNDSLLSGEGYMELTGYSEAIGGRM